MRDRTEGIELKKLQLPFLKRNISSMLPDEEDYANEYGVPQWNEDGLVVRISQDNYHLLYDPGTSDWWVHNLGVRSRGLGKYEDVKRERKERFEGLFGQEGRLGREMGGDEVGAERWRKGLEEGVWGEGGDESMGGV